MNTPCNLDFDGKNDYVICPEKTEHPELWRGLVGMWIPYRGTLINIVPCAMHGTIECWPWYRVLWRHLSGWARLWWAVAVRWCRGI